MKYLHVKGLEQPISELILGTAWFDLEHEAEVNELLQSYFEQGGNVLDTGRFYGAGKSEKMLAKWLKTSGKRDQLILINKACHHYIDENNVHYPEVNRVNPACITEDLEYSLHNMGVDFFDIYLLHRDNPEEPVAGLMDRLEQHRLEGKIKAYGVSNWTLERIEEALAYTKSKGYQGITVNNPSYSLATVGTPRWVGCVYADQEYAQWHEDKDVTLISWASQAAGFFADIYAQDGSAPQDIQAAYFSDENFEKLNRCKQLALQKGEGAEPINVALGYILNQSFPVAAVVGPRNTKEWMSTLQVNDLQLTGDEVNWLALEPVTL